MIEIKGKMRDNWNPGGTIDHHLFVNPDVILGVELFDTYATVQMSIWGETLLVVELDHARSIVEQVDILMKGRINS